MQKMITMTAFTYIGTKRKCCDTPLPYVQWNTKRQLLHHYFISSYFTDCL